MLTRLAKAAVAASCLLRAASAEANPQAIPTATTTMPMNAITSVGCFSTPAPMENHGPWKFQTSGNCQPICYELQQPVMGLVNGSDCYCGPELPPANTKVDDSDCSTPCNGYPQEMCGGDNFWTVYLTGITRNKIPNLDPASLSTTSTAGPSTVVVTATSTAKASGKGSSTVGVAVGVVVGLVAVAGIVGGVLFFLRRRRQQEVEEEYKRQAAVSTFVNGGKSHQGNSSPNDSRLDPEILAGRRISNGSIADNADYSRRILQVRNPDGF